MLGLRSRELLHLWSGPGVAVDAQIVCAGGTGGAIGLEGSESVAKSADKANIDAQAIGDDPASRIPLAPEPRRRARPKTRAHARATGEGDGGHMDGASGDGAALGAAWTWPQDDLGQGRWAGRVEREARCARCSSRTSTAWQRSKRWRLGAGFRVRGRNRTERRRDLLLLPAWPSARAGRHAGSDLTAQKRERSPVEA